MEISKTNEKLIKDIEEWNKQERNMYVNLGEKAKFEYIGVYALLDIILDRIKKCNNVEDTERYCNIYERIYKLLESKGE